MKLISSREAVQFLSQAAPKPWVNRLLRWLAYDEGLTVYAAKGEIRPYASVGDFTVPLFKEAGEFNGSKMDAAISDHFDEPMASGLKGKQPSDNVYDVPFIWDDKSDPKILDVGFFLFAEDVDWDAGTIKLESVVGHGQLAQMFFFDDEFLSSEFDRPFFDAEVSGLSFQFNAIEMLLPNFQLGATAGFVTEMPDRPQRVGRPQKWDWEAALAYIVSQAQTPDGLPTGQGAQARIEEMILSWFVAETGNSPAPSQIRQRASAIMRTLEKPV